MVHPLPGTTRARSLRDSAPEKDMRTQEIPLTTLPAPTARARPNRKQSAGLESAPRTAIFLTAFTLVGLLLGVAGARFLNSPLIASLGYGLANLDGGLPAIREAMRTPLRERKLNIDLLMVLAVIGAVSIG